MARTHAVRCVADVVCQVEDQPTTAVVYPDGSAYVSIPRTLPDSRACHAMRCPEGLCGCQA
eukprot:2779808-Rhodomonas_salina.1